MDASQSSLPGFIQVVDGLRTLNAVDVTLLTWLLYTTIEGMRRGFVAALLGIIALGASVVVASSEYIRVIEPIRDAGAWFLVGPVADTVAFVITFVVVRTAAWVVTMVITSVWRSTGGRLPVLGSVDTLLGAVPGFARGAIIGAIVVLPFRHLTWLETLSDAVTASVVANAIIDLAAGAIPGLRAVSGI